jgi:hypothetical protein
VVAVMISLSSSFFCVMRNGMKCCVYQLKAQFSLGTPMPFFVMGLGGNEKENLIFLVISRNFCKDVLELEFNFEILGIVVINCCAHDWNF